MLLGMAGFLRNDSEWTLSPFECLQGFDAGKVTETLFAGAMVLDSGRCDETLLLTVARQLPTVVVGCSEFQEGVSTLAIDEIAVASLAASVLTERGFKSVAFVGHMGHRRSAARQAAFCDALRSKGIAPFLFLTPDLSGQEPTTAEDLRHLRQKIRHWIVSLPHRTGLYAINDCLAYECCRAALELGRSVPEQLAIIGTNDDELLCRISNPGLSSIRIPFEKMGHDAAAELVRLLRERERGKAAEVRHRKFEPTGLIMRESSNTFVVSDPVVGEAVQFIQNNFATPINVESVIKALKVSRSVLERRFREDLGVTPLMHLRRTRIERARELLCDGSQSIQSVGRQCGFSSAIRFATVFKEHIGVTPSQFRKQMLPNSIK